jgi:hypothetical protein
MCREYTIFTYYYNGKIRTTTYFIILFMERGKHMIDDHYNTYNIGFDFSDG